MSLDVPTLFVIAIFASTVAGLLLLLSWLQNRNVRALAWWAAAFIIGAVGVALIAVRGDIPDIWSIGIANAIIAAAYGIMWAGVAISRATRRPCLSCSRAQRSGSLPVRSRHFLPRRKLALR